MRAAAVLVLLLAGCVDPDAGEDGDSSWTAVEADPWGRLLNDLGALRDQVDGERGG